MNLVEIAHGTGALAASTIGLWFRSQLHCLPMTQRWLLCHYWHEPLAPQPATSYDAFSSRAKPIRAQAFEHACQQDGGSGRRGCLPSPPPFDQDADGVGWSSNPATATTKLSASWMAHCALSDETGAAR